MIVCVALLIRICTSGYVAFTYSMNISIYQKKKSFYSFFYIVGVIIFLDTFQHPGHRRSQVAHIYHLQR